jgi:23S rRNA pseudouridine1911/1915/1917 synthase
LIPRYPGQPPKDFSRPIETLDLRVDMRQAGMRLDRALCSFLHWRSRSSIHRLIAAGMVELEGRRARPSTRVQWGEHIVVHIPRQNQPAPDPATELPIPILHEDRWMVAVDKPPGVAVHPSGRRIVNTLIHFLHRRYRRPDLPEHDVVPRLLHRIDRETSGVVAVGLDEQFHAQVARQFEERTVAKTYLAVVHGCPTPVDGRIDLGIGPAHRSSVRLKLEARRDGSGFPAMTDYRVVRRSAQFSLVELRPRTGRTHQLRVHMAAIGCPLVGDKIYGQEDHVFLDSLAGRLTDADRTALVLDRHALHAHRLRFFHPGRGSELELEAPLPPDMAALVE